MEFYFIFAILLLSNSEVFCQTVCTCDLTASVCDVNCCCDADCSSALVATFPCSDATFNTDSQLCDYTIIFVNNIPTTEVVQENGVFCIVTDNRQERNSYTTPVLITTPQEFDSTLQQYPTFTYDLSTPSPVTGTYYKAGDTIDIRYSTTGFLGKFPSPVSGIASTCLDNNPASFLNDEQSTCYRQVDNSLCRSSNVLDVNLYMAFQVAKLPVINATSLTSADFVDVTLCNQSVANAPTLNGSQCINAATQITYQILFNGTSGISSVCLSYVIGSISSTITQWPQTYNIIYLSANTNLSIVDQQNFRSGNPGYVTGKPLRTAISSAGNLTFAPNQLYLIPQTPSGLCSDAAAATFPPINFREDARTGCLLSYNSTTVCTDIYNSISLLLNISSNIRVSTFGNTLDSSPGDWIEMQFISTFPEAPAAGQSVAGLCMGIPVSLNYNVFYANTNNISNPQPKIIGVEVAIQTTTVSYQCPGWNCVASQNLEVTSSVTFIDTSSSPAAVLKERPTVDARLPSDFFFPFTSN